MKRIDGAGATGDKHFTVGNPGTGTPATTVTDDYMNIIMEEIASLIEYVGLTLDQTHTYSGSPAHDCTQLRKAIVLLASSNGSGGVTTIVFGASPYTAVATKKTIPCDTSGGNIVVNLPVATSFAGEQWEVIKTTADGNTVTVNPNGADNILGANSGQVISTQWGSLRFKSLGALGWIP